MNTIKNISKYIIIILIGIIFAIFIARIQHDTQDLSASVLSLTEQNFFESTKWDAGYKKENQIFEIFLAEQSRNAGPLTISILYSPTDIERETNQLSTDYNAKILQQNEGNLIINIDGYKNADFSKGVFELPYSGDSKDITLEYIKSKKLNFAIGNLDNIENNQIH